MICAELATTHVSVFTGPNARGNPAGVVMVGRDFPPYKTMADIARTNRYPETAFVTDATLEKNGFIRHIRYYSNDGQNVDFCGHATAASAAVLKHGPHNLREVTFVTQEGLRVRTLTHVDKAITKVTLTRELMGLEDPHAELKVRLDRLGLPSAKYQLCANGDILALLTDKAFVVNYEPDFPLMKRLRIGRLVLVARTGADTRNTHEADFIVRYFAPDLGIPEDPATGSVAMWIAEWLGQKWADHTIFQASPRGGWLSIYQGNSHVAVTGVCEISATPIDF